MLKGICVDVGGTTFLEKGKTYFLFPNGPRHYYVSRFPKAHAHMGCFRSSLFGIIQEREDEWSPEPPADSIPTLDRSKVYTARLIWRERGYVSVPLATYYLKLLDTHAYFYYDSSMKQLGGCFPLHWFQDFREVCTAETNSQIIKEADSETFYREPSGTFEQMCIFDFIELKEG